MSITYPTLQQVQQSGARCYIASRGSVNDVVNACYKLTGAGRMYENIGDFLCGIWALPFSIPISNLTKALKVAIGTTDVGAGDYCYTILPTTNTTDIDRIATFSIDCRDRARNNFLDYGDYTLSTLYLPFFGLVKMESKIIFSSILTINYYLDVTTTTLGVRVISTNDGVLNTLIYESSTSIGTPLELRSTNSGYIAAQKQAIKEGFVIDTVGSIIDAVAFDRRTKQVRKLVGVKRIPKTMAKYNNEMNQITTLGSILTSGLRAASNIKALRQNGTRVSSLSQSGSLMSIREPFIVIEKCEYELPTNYGHEIGYIVNNEYTISELSGYTIFENVHLHIPCSEEELEEIEEMLLEGVIITSTPVPEPPPPEPEPEPEPTPEPEPIEPIEPETKWLSPWSGAFKVTSTYGEKRTYTATDGKVYRDIHRGLDMVGIGDINVYSIAEGTVEHIGWQDSSDQLVGFGYYCRINTNGKLFYYAHMRANSSTLKVGDKVSKGTKIGVMGSTGRVDGAHLHLEVRANTSPSSYENICSYTLLPNKVGIYE